MNARASILGRIRAAQGKSAIAAADERAQIMRHIAAHQPGPRPTLEGDMLERFRDRVRSLSSTVDEVDTLATAPHAVAQYLRRNGLPLTAVCWPELSALQWAEAGIAVEPRPAGGGDLVGITGAFCAIAETGTLLLLSGPRTPAVTSLLPETHVALVRADRLVATMEDAWRLVRTEAGTLPRAANFVSGPSRTADIEQTLTLGAHGPYRVHVVLVRESPLAGEGT